MRRLIEWFINFLRKMGHRVLFTHRYTRIKYGLLYNWYAATDARKIANTGWRVPNDADWTSLLNAIGGDSSDGYKLMTFNSGYWLNDSIGTNEFGFSARGAGGRNIENVSNSNFVEINEKTYYWSSTISRYKRYLRLIGSSGYTQLANGFDFSGYSIRLVSDAIGVVDGGTTVYIGNDSKAYSAVAINGLYWMQNNLVETKYRDGTSIPEVTDNTDWKNLTSGAICAYNNDWTNV